MAGATATKRRGPTKGSRITVNLPFGRNKTGGGQPAGKLIQIKQGVAAILGFKAVPKLPTKVVSFRTAKGTAKTTRLQQGSYKRRAVRLIFKAKKNIKGSGSYKSVSLPLPSGVTINDVVQYFSSGPGKSKGVAALVTPDGRRIQWDEVSVK